MSIKKRKKHILLIICVAIIICGYLLNKYTEKKNTYRAEIISIYKTLIRAKGFEENDDINFTDEFEFSVDETTIIMDGAKEIDISDLNVGDIISVTCSKEYQVLEVYPPIIKDIKKIQLLNPDF